jgi:hypothetical protein
MRLPLGLLPADVMQTPDTAVQQQQVLCATQLAVPGQVLSMPPVGARAPRGNFSAEAARLS